MTVAGPASAVSVLDDEPGDAKSVEPLGDLMPFVVHRQVAVAAAGTYDDGGAICPLGRGQINLQRRLVLLSVALGVRRTIRPQQFDLGIGRRGGEVG